MSIKHFEDLKPEETIHFLENIDQYTATEKVDGSQLLVGFDERGFYTSRETKGGARVYNVDNYELDFHNTYRRKAHSVLQSCKDLLLDSGMKTGDQIEIEVLYGALPNVVEYSADTNYIIFLRPTLGTPDIDCLNAAFSGKSIFAELLVPETNDGVNVNFVDKKTIWNIVKVPEWNIDIDLLKPIADRLRSEYDAILGTNELLLNMPYRDVLSIHLGKISGLGFPKKIVSDVRDRARILDHSHCLLIKSELLKHIVRCRPSCLGPSNGFIEGVVFTHPNGTRFKLVDKDLFREVQQFYWKVRNTDELTTDISPDDLSAYLDKYKNARKRYRLTVPYVDRIFVYSDPVHQRTLEAFASKRRRIINEN